MQKKFLSRAHEIGIFLHVHSGHSLDNNFLIHCALGAPQKAALYTLLAKFELFLLFLEITVLLTLTAHNSTTVSLKVLVLVSL